MTALARELASCGSDMPGAAMVARGVGPYLESRDGGALGVKHYFSS